MIPCSLAMLAMIKEVKLESSLSILIVSIYFYKIQGLLGLSPPEKFWFCPPETVYEVYLFRFNWRASIARETYIGLEI